MATLALFIFVIVHWLLQALIWLVIVAVIVDWLVNFQIINMRNRLAYNVVHMLQSATRPLLRPIQRVVPSLGGLDLSPMIFVIVVGAVDAVLLPAAYGAIVGAVG
ncbi:MAG TPA: YggT family protein [Caulobacteraceae bacterium]|nr:YggT family protein [Caulobacteraceae bacterium]